MAFPSLWTRKVSWRLSVVLHCMLLQKCLKPRGWAPILHRLTSGVWASFCSFGKYKAGLRKGESTDFKIICTGDRILLLSSFSLEFGMSDWCSYRARQHVQKLVATGPCSGWKGGTSWVASVYVGRWIYLVIACRFLKPEDVDLKFIRSSWLFSRNAKTACIAAITVMSVSQHPSWDLNLAPVEPAFLIATTGRGFTVWVFALWECFRHFRDTWQVSKDACARATHLNLASQALEITFHNKLKALYSL